MKDLNLKFLPADAYQAAGWLISLLIVIFGYKYFKEIVEYVMLKLYEFFIQHKQFNF